MDVQLNGQPLTLDDATTVDALIESQGLRHARVAVEINGAIVPRSQHQCWLVNPGDRIEIVRALGGG